jgi:hypothetical protein
MLSIPRSSDNAGGNVRVMQVSSTNSQSPPSNSVTSVTGQSNLTASTTYATKQNTLNKKLGFGVGERWKKEE